MFSHKQQILFKSTVEMRIPSKNKFIFMECDKSSIPAQEKLLNS